MVALPKYIAEFAHVVAGLEVVNQLIVLPEHTAAEGRVPGELAHVIGVHESADCST